MKTRRRINGSHGSKAIIREMGEDSFDPGSQKRTFNELADFYEETYLIESCLY
jgi:hypothetical protein